MRAMIGVLLEAHNLRLGRLIESNMHAIREISRSQVIIRMFQEMTAEDFPSSPGGMLDAPWDGCFRLNDEFEL